jgi:hypothetical protein
MTEQSLNMMVYQKNIPQAKGIKIDKRKLNRISKNCGTTINNVR